MAKISKIIMNMGNVELQYVTDRLIKKLASIDKEYLSTYSEYLEDDQMALLLYKDEVLRAVRAFKRGVK